MFDEGTAGQQNTGTVHGTSADPGQAVPRTRPETVGERMWADEDLTAPEDLIARLAGSRNLADNAIIDMIADVIFSGEWCISGIHSEHHWVAYKLGLSRRAAGRLITVAERRDELPFAFEAFAEGKLSLDQMVLIARYCPTGYDRVVAVAAVNATFPQLRRILRDYRFPEPDPEPEPDPAAPTGEAAEAADSGEAAAGEAGSAEPGSEAAADAGCGHGDAPGSSDGCCDSDQPPGFRAEELDKPYRGFGYGFDDDGNFRMWLRCGPDDGAEISAAMDQARAWLKADTGETDVSGFEAFLAMIRAGVEADPSASRGADNRVVIHLDGRDLGAWANGLRPSLHLGPILPPDALELLSCDGSVRVVNYSFGRPVSLGRSQKLVPNALRRIILFRDNGCRFPGCSSQRWLDVHHMKHWSKGGATESNNLVCLCRRHHREHHRGGFWIEGDPEILFGVGSLRFFGQGGREIARPVPVPEPPPVGRYVHGTGECFDASLVHFPANKGRRVERPPDEFGSGGSSSEEGLVAEAPPSEDPASDGSAFGYVVREDVPMAGSVGCREPAHPGAP